MVTLQHVGCIYTTIQSKIISNKSLDRLKNFSYITHCINNIGDIPNFHLPIVQHFLITETPIPHYQFELHNSRQATINPLNPLIRCTTFTALNHAKTLLDQVKLYELKIQSHITHSQMTDALDMGLHVLSLLGIEFDQTPPIQEENIEDLINLPSMTDPSKLAAMRILMTLMSPAFIANPALLAPIAFTMINLTLKNGHSPPSA